MPTTSTVHDTGIAEVVMDNPPVNALTVSGWFELAELLTSLGRDPSVRVVLLLAEVLVLNLGF
jgi:enoyl-CoA hydratase